MSVPHIEHEINATVAIAFQWDMTGLQSSRSSLTLSPSGTAMLKMLYQEIFFSRKRLAVVSKNAKQIDATFRKIKIDKFLECLVRGSV
jgi:hypothetical protein